MVDGSGNRKKEGRLKKVLWLRTEGVSAMLERGRCENEEDEKNDVPVERVVKLASCAWVSQSKKN